MTKSKLNLIIDGLLLLCMASIAGIGLLMKYVLVPRYQRFEIYGRNVELFFWGFDRHQWGTIHLAIGLVFIALLFLHVVLHWEIIVTIYRKLVPAPLMRNIIAAILIGLTALLIAFPCFVKPKVREAGHREGPGRRGLRTPIRLTQ